MATAPHDLQFDEQHHAVFMHAFDDATRQRLMDDDSTAWRYVTGILMSIVALGLALAVFVVLVTL